MADTREGALKNLQKAGIPGPGRKPQTPEQKAQSRCIRDYIKEWLKSPDAVATFEKAKKQEPLKTLNMAMDRTYGPVRQSIEHSGEVEIKEIVVKFKGADSDK